MLDTSDCLGPPRPIEHRAERRTRTCLSGKVLFANTSISGDCLVKNTSRHGAKITLPHPEMYPADPILLLIKQGLICETRTIWRQDQDIGLRYGRTFGLDATLPAHLIPARRILVENLLR